MERTVSVRESLSDGIELVGWPARRTRPTRDRIYAALKQGGYQFDSVGYVVSVEPPIIAGREEPEWEFAAAVSIAVMMEQRRQVQTHELEEVA